MSQTVLLILEIIGTVAFAVSGAMTGIRKNMDVFGVSILGLTTAVGGGVIRDLLLGVTPPTTFRNPLYALIALGVSLVIFVPTVRHLLNKKQHLYEIVMLVMDSLGLGVFTVVGVEAALSVAETPNLFLTLFVAVVTGVGGGVIRDMMAQNTPYIFVKHFYASAALVGAAVTVALWYLIPHTAATLIGFVLIVILRLLAAYFHWSLPKAHD